MKAIGGVQVVFEDPAAAVISANLYSSGVDCGLPFHDGPQERILVETKLAQRLAAFRAGDALLQFDA